MCRFELNRFALVIFLTLGSSIHCSAATLWSTTGSMTLGPIGALYSITTGGATSATSIRTDYAFYSTTTCSGGATISTSSGGSYTFNAPSTVQANGDSLYAVALAATANNTATAQAVQSIQIAPVNSSGHHIFPGTDYCFQVTYMSGAYVYSGSAASTTLNNT